MVDEGLALMVKFERWLVFDGLELWYRWVHYTSHDRLGISALKEISELQWNG